MAARKESGSPCVFRRLGGAGVGGGVLDASWRASICPCERIGLLGGQGLAVFAPCQHPPTPELLVSKLPKSAQDTALRWRKLGVL